MEHGVGLHRRTSVIQGRSDGWYIGIYTPPKSAQVNFLWGKNDVRTAIQQFYTPPSKKKQISGYAPGVIIVIIIIVYYATGMQQTVIHLKTQNHVLFAFVLIEY